MLKPLYFFISDGKTREFYKLYERYKHVKRYSLIEMLDFLAIQ